MGVVNGNTVPVLIKMIQAGKLDPTSLISHHFRFSEIVQAYDLFRNAAEERAIKIVLSCGEDSARTVSSSDEQLVRQIVTQILAAI